MREFLESQQVAKDVVDQVVAVVQGVSYSKEVKLIKSRQQLQMTPELAIVQDADRLDAIGAVGIARSFCFGGARNAPMYSVEDLQDAKTTLGHFHDKLFKLQSMLKTQSGRRLSRERHDFMLQFVKQIEHEIGHGRFDIAKKF